MSRAWRGIKPWGAGRTADQAGFGLRGVHRPECERATQGEIHGNCVKRHDSGGAKSSGWAECLRAFTIEWRGCKGPEVGRPCCLPFLRREENMEVTPGGQGRDREVRCSGLEVTLRTEPQERRKHETRHPADSMRG